MQISVSSSKEVAEKKVNEFISKLSEKQFGKMIVIRKITQANENKTRYTITGFEIQSAYEERLLNGGYEVICRIEPQQDTYSFQEEDERVYHGASHVKSEIIKYLENYMF